MRPQTQTAIFIAVFIMIVVSPTPSFSMSIDSVLHERGKAPIVTGWRISFSDDPRYVVPDFDDSGWEQVDLPFAADRARSNRSQFLWLRNSIVIGKGLENDEVYLLLGKLNGAAEAYVNGVLVLKSGSMPPDFQYFGDMPKQAIIPNALVRYGEKNTIAVRYFNEFNSFRVQSIDLGDHDAYLVDSQLLRFINKDINLLYSFLSLVIGGYFLLQFLARKAERTNLFFSLANFSFFLYFLNMGLEVNFLPYYLGTALSQMCLPLFFALLVVFFVNYFSLHNSKWFKRIVMGLGIILSSLFLFNMKYPQLIEGLFTYVLLPGALELIFMVYVGIRASIERRKGAVPVMIGALCGFVLGIHDMIYQITGMQPFAWFQGTGIFLFNMSMFVSLANKTIRAFQSLEMYSAEVRQKTGELETYIRNIDHVSGKVSGMSSTLGESIIAATASIEKMVRSSQSMNENIREQSDSVRKASSNVVTLINSLDNIYIGLNKQFNHVQETSATIEEMIATIGEITKNVKNTADFTDELTSIIALGTDAVAKSSESIEEIRIVSDNVNAIIEAVSNIAEQTNVLSINAAIEASHAGVYGRGFAVVASEIRKLAEGTSVKSKDIGVLIKSIGEKIRKGVRTNDRVREVFDSINDKTITAVERVREIYGAVLEQKTASEDIRRILSLLQSSSEEIKEQADKQSSSGGIIRSNLDTLVRDSESVIGLVSGIAHEIDSVRKSIEDLKSISDESVHEILRLRTLLEEKSSE